MTWWGTWPDRATTIRTSAAVAAALAMGVGLTPLEAQESAGTGADVTRYSVGATGIECAASPCPRRGIWVTGDGDETPAQIRKALLFADEDGSIDLPNLRGSATDRATVDDAWNAGSCMIVEGDFGPHDQTGIPVLMINRVVGPC